MPAKRWLIAVFLVSFLTFLIAGLPAALVVQLVQKPLAASGVPNFEMQSWQGVFAPAGTPAAVVDRLAKEIAAIVALPDVQGRLRNFGVEPDGRTADAFAAFQRAEITKWSKVIQQAGIQAE